MCWYIESKCWKLKKSRKKKYKKEKEKILKAATERPYILGYEDNSVYLIFGRPEKKKDVSLKVLKEKTLATHNSISSENILQKWKCKKV